MRSFFTPFDGIELANLRAELKQAQDIFAPFCESDSEHAEGSSENKEENNAQDTRLAPSQGSSGQGFSGPVQNRGDVIKRIDEVCQYYNLSEPSSPVPLLLTRAKRLVNLDFFSIVKDLAPDGEGQVSSIIGSGQSSDE